MRRRILQLLSNRFPALLWTIIIFILLALPGNMLPSEEHLEVPNLDKYVHIILFASFVFLWSIYYATRQEKKTHSGKRFLLIMIIACLYGTAMEYVQKYFIPNRDFDIYDIASDVAGAVAGYVTVRLTVSWFRTS